MVRESVREQLGRLPPPALDAAPVAVVAVANGIAIAGEHEAGAKEPDALAFALGAALAAPLLVRRRSPLGHAPGFVGGTAGLLTRRSPIR